MTKKSVFVLHLKKDKNITELDGFKPYFTSKCGIKNLETQNLVPGTQRQKI